LKIHSDVLVFLKGKDDSFLTITRRKRRGKKLGGLERKCVAGKLGGRLDVLGRGGKRRRARETKQTGSKKDGTPHQEERLPVL